MSSDSSCSGAAEVRVVPREGRWAVTTDDPASDADYETLSQASCAAHDLATECRLAFVLVDETGKILLYDTRHLPSDSRSAPFTGPEAAPRRALRGSGGGTQALRRP